jgi:aspartate/methionine/tyrosine aminotransferase
MNPLAEELNKTLQGTVADDLLSEFGKRFYFPKGIVAQSAEAKKHAKRFNVTIGMAYHKDEPIELPTIKNALPELSSSEAVSYAPTTGDPELRNLWKELIVEKNPETERDAMSLPVVVSGLTNGIMQAADLFADPGDSIIIPDMFWGNYRLIFEGRNKAQIRSFPFFTEEGSLNVSGLEETIRTYAGNSNADYGKSIVVLNFPNNPTGYSPTIQEADRIKGVLSSCADDGIKLAVIIDDAYFGLFYDDHTYKHSIFSKLYNLHENLLAIKVDGATKEDFVWGFRLGFVTFAGKGLKPEHYEALTTKLGGAIRSSISNSSRPAQSMLKHAITNSGYRKEKQAYFSLLQSRYQKVREIIDQRTTGLSLKPLPFNSGYFMSFYFEGGSAEELRKELLFEEGIGTISIQDTYLRIAYSSIDEENLEELYTTIFAAADRLSSDP